MSIIYLLLTILIIFVTGPTWAQTAAPSVIIPQSSVVHLEDAGKRAHTNTLILQLGDPKAAPPDLFGATPQLPPFPGFNYETPASLACLYGLVKATAGCNPRTLKTNATTGSKVVAIVNAYDAPTVLSDLKKYSRQFGLPAINSANFQVIYAAGTRPPYDQGWAQESGLDVEMVHALAPMAKIILVEAASNSFVDMLQAETVAAKAVAAAGGGEVSNSWGSEEFPAEMTAAYTAPFTKAKVVFFAATGNNSPPSYPAVLPTLVAVGGTSILRDSAGNFIAETTWRRAGAGPSMFVPRPGFQSSVKAIVGSKRGTPDISAVANPNTGVWVYWNGGWYIFGGTSVATPILAAITNSANHFKTSTTAELVKIYANISKTSFRDIKQGTCGDTQSFSAALGYDFCTGVGTPHGFSGL